MIEKFKNYLILGLGLTVMVLFLMKCGSGGKTKPIYIKGKDSVIIVEIPRPYEIIKFKDKWYPKWDTAYIEKGDTIPIIPITRIYNDSSTFDSNITIYSKQKIKGMIIKQELSYRLKTPLRIEKTIFRTDTLIKPNNINLYGGLSIAGNKTSLDIKPYLSLNYGSKNVFISYGIMKKEIQLGIGIRLFKSKQ